MITKQCTKCGESLPFDCTFFYRNKNTVSGLSPARKACIADTRLRKLKLDEAREKPWPPFSRWYVYQLEEL